MKHAAVACGIGQIGKSSLLLNPQYGNRLILGTLLTNVAFESDPFCENICIPNYTKRIQACPVSAIHDRSLFYEDTEETVCDACDNVELYASNFGYSGTCYDYLCDIAAEGIDFSELVDLSITDDEIADIFNKAGFSGYRLDGAKKWIRNTIEIVKELGHRN